MGYCYPKDRTITYNNFWLDYNVMSSCFPQVELNGVRAVDEEICKTITEDFYQVPHSTPKVSKWKRIIEFIETRKMSKWIKYITKWPQARK